MTIVLDTNCLIQILPKLSPHRWLYDAILQGEIVVCITTEIIAEYEETINSFYDSTTLGGNICQVLTQLPETRKINVYFNWQLIQADPDDNKYVDCAVAANADFILTNDKHFNVLKNVDFPKIACLSMEDFEHSFRT